MHRKSERISMKRIMNVTLVLVSALFPAIPAAHAQTAASKESQSVSEQYVRLLREDIQSKKQLIAANLPLTTREAMKFWPVYDQYSAEITKIGDQRYALIKEYVSAIFR
jgi:hypothetical protein